ncbi:hypothetical protein SDJN02_19801, partial [Cucurbita argyrosperma subsp. argyrosperma]
PTGDHEEVRNLRVSQRKCAINLLKKIRFSYTSKEPVEGNCTSRNPGMKSSQMPFGQAQKLKEDQLQDIVPLFGKS